ncbi:MAG: hypothetical protein JWM93_3531 [Frankiales bacterium]|nr:hypothetical protein [Frankiales bacterium]
MGIGHSVGFVAIGAALSSVVFNGVAAADAVPSLQNRVSIETSLPSDVEAQTRTPVEQMPSWPKQSCTVDRGPVHFRTAAASMRYLARAYNCADITALRRVTTPDTRNMLRWMTIEAVNMRLGSCTLAGSPGWHYYDCTFTHDYPTGVPHDDADADGNGQAFLVARPATRPGWYAGAFAGCG